MSVQKSEILLFQYDPPKGVVKVVERAVWGQP